MIRGLLMIVGHSLRQHALSTAVTVISVALGAGLVMSVFNVNRQVSRAFDGGEVGFDAVLGARGSQLQLVLNTVFHLETSPGNIPWTLYQEVKRDPRVKLAIPYAVGDNYRNYRIVGTTTEMFTDFEYQAGRKFEIVGAARGARVFNPYAQECVIGSTVAQEAGLKVGSVLFPYHGFTYDESAKHDAEYVVTGVMKPTNTPSDRVVWIPIEGLFRMEGHGFNTADGGRYVPKKGELIPDEVKEVSAVMLKFSNPAVGLSLRHKINQQGRVATLAFPIAAVMTDLFKKMGWFTVVLRWVAYLVVLVAAGSVLASIYNTMNERRREFAILRALGARSSTVFAAIVLESSTITLLGGLVGYAIYFTIFGLVSFFVRNQTGVFLDMFVWHPVLLWTPLGMTALGAVSGVLPAWKAYSTDVAENLHPST